MAATYGHGSFGGFAEDPCDIAKFAPDSSLSPEQVITNNIQAISHDTQQLQNFVQQIGTELDSESLRARIKEIQKHLNNKVKKTNQELKDLVEPLDVTDQELHKWKVQRRLLTENFHTVLQTYHDLQSKTRDRMRATIRHSFARSIEIDETTTGDASHIGDETTQTTLDTVGAEVDLAIVQEREEEIVALENDIVDLADMFKDLSTMVTDQGEQIDRIEKNVDDTDKHIEDGTKELAKASNLADDARRKKAFIVIIVVCVLAVVVLFIVLAATKVI